jgi:hypothetical protein
MNGLEGAGFRDPTVRERLLNPVRTVWHWVYSNLHLALQSYHVLDAMAFRALGPGLLPPDHPWATGMNPETGRPIWPENLVFASPPARMWRGPPPEADAAIVTRVGQFLAGMVQRSLREPEVPHGPRRRMPHGVNYLHGSIHYNGGFAVFNDFADGRLHLSDPAFTREVRRFARDERRELTLVFRERSYAPEEYAWFVAFVRARLPWYANGNGPTKKRVLWGTPSPYAAVNPINGTWAADVRALRRGRLDALARPPIRPGTYFRGCYRGWQADYTFLERFHAWAQSLLIRGKGFQGNLAFTRRRTIEPQRWLEYRLGEPGWETSYPVPHPFAPIDRVRRRRLGVPDGDDPGITPGNRA